MKNTETAERQIITDKLVFPQTGKTLEEWYLFLDGKGAQKLSHKEIFTLVQKVPGLVSLGEWNHNLLTTSYEWSRGLRERGQKEDGFEVSVSKTITVPVAILYQSFIDERLRVRWLAGHSLLVRKATENKSVRITWSDGDTSLSVDFYSKGVEKSQVVVQHQKIKTVEQSIELKAFWGERLTALKAMMEG